MKQKDLLLLAVVAVVSGVVALVLSNMFFSSPQKRTQQAEVVDAISAEFPSPNKDYFNTEAVNPAQPVEIGTSTNSNPFAGQ